MNYRNSQDACRGCGSTYEDRQRNHPNETYLGLSECPHCGTDKCVMCDMGDDVECGSCEQNEEH